MQTNIKQYLKPSIKVNGETFKLILITKDYIFYVNQDEGDDNANTVMLNRNLELLSNNYFASVGLLEELEKGVFEYMNKDLKYSYEEMIKDGYFEE